MSGTEVSHALEIFARSQPLKRLWSAQVCRKIGKQSKPLSVKSHMVLIYISVTDGHLRCEESPSLLNPNAAEA